jgi:hypothetical protein
MSAVRGTIELLKALKHSLHTGWIPFAAVCGECLARVQLSRDGVRREEAFRLKFSNCRSQCFGSRISGTLAFLALLILPPLPDIRSPSRVSILNTVVYCHLPPRAVGIFRRFNSSASACRDTKPAARSLRRVEAKARARASAARLMTSGPARIPRRLRDEAFPHGCFIRTPWPDGDVLLAVVQC